MMTTEYLRYPRNLPLPSVNYNGTYKTPTVSTQFTSGKIRRRRVGRTSVKQVTLEWLFTPDEYDAWEVFYRDALKDGCDKFSISMSTGGPSQTGVHVVQCINDYSFSHEECNWRVSVECVLSPFPRGDGVKLLETMLGFSISQMEEIVNKYYDSRYML